jgi:hypothetical protein
MNEMILSKEDIYEVLGEEALSFILILNTMEDMIADPTKYVGQKAVLEAIRLAAYRTRIGASANWLKSQERDIKTRRRKDLLISMENNLLENINCLKLAGKIEAKNAGLL